MSDRLLKWLALGGVISGPLTLLVAGGVCILQGECWDPDHAISDMGIQGQPYAGWLNYLGLAFSGVLFTGFAIALDRWLGRSEGPGARLLMLAGLGMVLAGIFPFPEVMHFVGVTLMGVGGTIGLLVLARPLSRRLDSIGIKWLCRLLALTPLAHPLIVIPAVLGAGYYQRGASLVGVLGFTYIAARVFGRLRAAAADSTARGVAPDAASAAP